jgi:toxin ParE1/3/4
MPEAFTIEWSDVAFADLDAIIEYVAHEDSVDAARRMYAKLIERVASLAALPLRCRTVPELRAIGVVEFRELLVGPHRVCFRLYGHVVAVVAVLDGRRDLAELLMDRALRFTDEC